MTAQPTLALDVAVRPPHWRCVCGREGDERLHSLLEERHERLRRILEGLLPTTITPITDEFWNRRKYAISGVIT